MPSIGTKTRKMIHYFQIFELSTSLLPHIPMSDFAIVLKDRKKTKQVHPNTKNTKICTKSTPLTTQKKKTQNPKQINHIPNPPRSSNPLTLALSTGTVLPSSSLPHPLPITNPCRCIILKP